MASGARKFRDPRAERLRAKGLIGVATNAPVGPEALRRATASKRAGLAGTDLRPALHEEVRRRQGEFAGEPMRVAISLLTMTICGAIGYLSGGFVAMVVVAAIGMAGGMMTFSILGQSRLRAMAAKEFGTAQAFDVLLSKCGERLPDEANNALAVLKKRLMPVLADLAVTQPAGGTFSDDAFFVHELVRRYLPDALEPYLAIREPGAEAGKALVDQIELLSERLGEISKIRDQAHEGQLMRNKSFIERKLDQ